MNEELKGIIDSYYLKDLKLKYFSKFTSPYLALSYFIDKKYLSNEQTDTRDKALSNF